MQSTALGLHLHSNYSDGSDSPEELVKKVIKNGIYLAALTDHNTLQGVEEFLFYCKKNGVIAISGVEISTMYQGHEVHILGYNIEHKRADVEGLLKNNSMQSLVRTKKTIKSLNELKLLEATFEDLMQYYKYPGYCISLMHVMDYLVFEQGFSFEMVKKIMSIVENSLGPKNNSNIFSAHEGVRLIKELNGISVLAHPGEFEKQIIGSPFKKRDALFGLLSELKQVGLKGVEVFHPKHDKSLEVEYERFIGSMNLAVMAGSDYHGKHKPHHGIGCRGVSVEKILDLIGY